MRLRQIRVIFSVLFLTSSFALAQTDTKKLETIQSLIAQTQQNLNEKLADSERLQQQLKLAELKIAEAATQLNQTDQELVVTGDEMKQLDKDKIELENQISQQQSALASQIKSAYLSGDYDFAKMIFSQDKANKFERMLTYYQYLNKARQNQIDGFSQLVSQLETLRQDLSNQLKRLADLKETQQSQASKLRDLQQQRYVSLQALNAEISSEREKVLALTQQENDLLAAIEAAQLDARRQQELKDDPKLIELQGLSTLQGNLQKPTEGRVQRLFGKRRQGQVRWKGIVINTKSGSKVNAVADGIVLYSDWLKGFGLVIIVDHGQGYMSVYGRNQALLRNVGDVVLAGDAISLAGTSGGQTRASLYFEIRHKGKALNPSKWLIN